MGLFGPNIGRDIHKSLNEIKDIRADMVLNAKNLEKVREWLTSINTRIKNGTLKGDESVIHDIKIILEQIEKREEKENEGIQKIQNLMYQLVR